MTPTAMRPLTKPLLDRYLGAQFNLVSTFRPKLTFCFVLKLVPHYQVVSYHTIAVSHSYLDVDLPSLSN